MTRTNFEWPDDLGEALAKDVNVYIDASGSMERDIKRVVAFVERFRPVLQRVYTTNSYGVMTLVDAMNRVGRSQIKEIAGGGDGAQDAFDHARRARRRMLYITDGDFPAAVLAPKSWACALTHEPAHDAVERLSPAKIYILPMWINTHIMASAPNAEKLADTMARASRAAMEGMANRKAVEEVGCEEPVFGPISSNEWGERENLELLAETVLAYESAGEAWAVATDIVEAKRKRESEAMLVTLQELASVGPLYQEYAKAFRAVLLDGADRLSHPNREHLARLWRSLKPVHDFVKEALGE